MIKISDHFLDQCKKRLKTESDNWTAGVCAGAVLYAHGPKIGADVTETHGACHSWITQAYAAACFDMDGKRRYFVPWDCAYRKEDAYNFLTLTCHSAARTKRNVTKEASDFLIHWMAKESPFIEHILNKDDDKSLKDGLILLCGPDGLTLPQAMWICKVLRFTTEGGQAAQVFMELVKGGVDGMLAIYVASHIRHIDRTGAFIYSGLEMHSTVCHENAADLIGMMRRELNDKASDTSHVFIRGAKFKNIQKNLITTKPIPDTHATKRIKGFCKPYVMDDGWGGKVEGEGVSGAELVERTLEWQKDLMVWVQTDPAIYAPKPKADTVYLDFDL